MHVHSPNCGSILITLPMLSLDDMKLLMRLVLFKGWSIEAAELPQRLIGDLIDGGKHGNSMFLAINNFLTYASASTWRIVNSAMSWRTNAFCSWSSRSSTSLWKISRDKIIKRHDLTADFYRIFIMYLLQKHSIVPFKGVYILYILLCLMKALVGSGYLLYLFCCLFLNTR